MAEQAPQPAPAESVPQAMPPSAGASAVAVPPESSKKGPGLLWFVVVLVIAILVASAYFFFTQLQKPVEETSQTSPSFTTQQGKPNQGFVSSTPAPAATPTLTSSDSVSDIEKDLSGTTIEAGNSSEFDADLQNL